MFEEGQPRLGVEYRGIRGHSPREADVSRLLRSQLAGGLGGAKLTFLFLEILDLALPGAVEAATLDEADDGVQLAGVEERAMTAADIHDRAGQAPEVEPV